MNNLEISPKEIDDLFAELSEFRKRGYFLNPKEDATRVLVKALLKNEKKYGHQVCPCRLSGGSREADLDIICPCDYRDQDLLEYGICYCGLYVSKKVAEGKEASRPALERRPNKEERLKIKNMENEKIEQGQLPFPVWRCSVCGYICAREEAPEICPICGATHDRFAKFM